MIDINGMAHVMLTVSDFESCQPFYRSILTEFGMVPVIDEKDWLYCVGGRTAVGIMRADEKYRKERFVQKRIGLHHLCFRAKSRQDVDKLEKLLIEMKATIVHAAEEGLWAPGYYSILFEDPDGTRLEMNYVPGKGLLEDKKATS